MTKAMFVWLGIGLIGAGALSAAELELETLAPAHTASQRAVLDRYCVTCHNQQLLTGGLALDTVDVEQIGEAAQLWEKVRHKLQRREMPPVGMPRPDVETYQAFATYLESELDAAAAKTPNPGRSADHRLNRAQYANAIRDLLGLEIDSSALLPADDVGYGFDNIGDVLTVSPMLLERYLSAAGKISRLAVGDTSIRPFSEIYAVPHALVQEDHMNEALPFGSRGGVAIPHYFPLDAEYEIRIQLQRDKSERLMGLDRQRQLDLRLDGSRLKLFQVGGEERGGPGPNYGYQNSEEQFARQNYYRSADANLKIRFQVEAGTHLIGATFVKDTLKPEGVLKRDDDQSFFEGVGSVTVSGPYDPRGSGETLSRQKIFICYPAGGDEERTCAEKIVSNLARRAYRRPVAGEEIPTLMKPYWEGHKKGGFENGIKLALQRILVSPEFLFRVERDPAGVEPGTAFRITDLELASRLSFFLWSSIPDEELLGLAERGTLRKPEVLEMQVRRMLQDPRSKTLVTNFAGQWLYLRNIQSVLPDPTAFPDFDENLRTALLTETELLLEDMLRQDRSVVDLLDSDYTFLNERLASHYGIPGVYGSDFRRVTLTDDNRKGLLGQGSILTVTSYANRTSPTLRGKWLLENLLGSPPPPPPPDVPSLREEKQGQARSMRERMEDHRVNPACASCHARMDPMGLALENFDGLGRWRDTSGAAKTPIDASGVLPDGTEFDGPAGLRKLLLSRQQEFIHTVTERILTYALGRGVEYYDHPVVREIARQTAKEDYRWSSLILGVVKSAPFQMRRSREL